MLDWAQTFLTPVEQVQVGIEAATQDVSTGDIPPFVNDLQAWSYNQGLAFITSLESEGGLEAIDRAFEHPPTSTEQVIHPERYPNDAPTAVDVPDRSAMLGDDWTDLDVMTIGEEWLQLALNLQLDGSQSSQAATGWDGGTYRAWTDGDQVAVELSTVWDTERDASEFATAMTAWLDDGQDLGVVVGPDGTGVRVLFASDDATLQALQAAVI